MNILIVGSGAREHAIASALHRSPSNPKIFCCGTTNNPGIAQMAVGYWVGDITDVKLITQVAQEWQIGLAIIGPEAPLEQGLANELWQASIPTIGPKKELAQIETSKAYTRDLMQKYKIKGLPKFKVFENKTGLADFLRELGALGYVIKANGLMGGKGVKVAGDHLQTFAEALRYAESLLEQQSIVIEEKLVGEEFSLMCFCDGEHIIPMPVVQDHKRAFDEDKGPNTGGMGSYSDTNHSLPFLSETDLEEAMQINRAVLHALTQESNEKYIGILYGSFIATKEGIYVIEFNARFGDPEAMNVLCLLDSDFVQICLAMVTGNLSQDLVQFKAQATVCKYAVPKGYPDHPVSDVAIDVSAVKNKAQLYFASVHAEDGKIIATGSRTAAYVGMADSIHAAEEIAEKEICGIAGPLFHRKDIGTEALIQRRVDAMRKIRGEE